MFVAPADVFPIVADRAHADVFAPVPSNERREAMRRFAGCGRVLVDRRYRRNQPAFRIATTIPRWRLRR